MYLFNQYLFVQHTFINYLPYEDTIQDLEDVMMNRSEVVPALMEF